MNYQEPVLEVAGDVRQIVLGSDGLGSDHNGMGFPGIFGYLEDLFREPQTEHAGGTTAKGDSGEIR